MTTDLATSIAARLAEVRATIEAACARASRDPSEVTLVAVSKGAPPEAARAAVEAGARDLGENRAQELVPKALELRAAGLEPRWHFIGHLQRNKAAEVAPHIAALHSLDSVRLVEALDRALATHLDRTSPDAAPALPCYLEVNVSGESSKGGIAPSELDALLAAASRARHIEVAGLMTIAPLVSDPSEARPVFRALRELASAHGLTGLSMGMTNDYPVAIEEGATIVRVGRAIFGERG